MPQLTVQPVFKGCKGNGDKMAEYELTSFHENTKITNNCLATIDKKKKKAEIYQKATLHPRTKKKPQHDGRRGAIKIKSNLIPAGWVTYKLENNYTTEVFP